MPKLGTEASRLRGFWVFRVRGLGLRGLGLRVWDLGFRASWFGVFRVWGLGFRGFGGLGFRGFRVWGLGV